MASRPSSSAGTLSSPRGRWAATVLGALLVVVALLAFTAIALRFATDAVHDSARAKLRATSRAGAQDVALQLSRATALVQARAQQLTGLDAPRRARLDRRDAARVGAVLRAAVADDDTAGAVLTDPLGRVVAASPRMGLAPGADLSGQDWYRGLRARGATYISRASPTPAAGGPTVQAATAVRGAGGRVVALLALTPQITTGGVDGARVVDRSGAIVAGGRAARGLLSLRSDPLVRAALAGRAEGRVRSAGGRRVVSRAEPTSSPASGRWAVLVDEPTSSAWAGLSRVRTTLIVGALVLGFLLLWLIPLLVARLGRAREALTASRAFQSDFFPEELPPGVRARYIASEQRMLLGGDFLDAARTPDDTVTLCIGDVCGHGPRAAALGATLRAAWRTLSFGPTPVNQLGLLERIVISERRDPDVFATIAAAVVSPLADHVSLVLGGHPPPLLWQDGEVEVLDGRRGPALGLGGTELGWPLVERDLHGPWALILYTDGVIEAPADGGARLGVDGLAAMVRRAASPDGLDSAALLAAVSGLAADRPLPDDVAIIVVDGAELAEGSERIQMRTTLFG